jgi:predicted DNA-binding transcriptional regulator YafY
MSNNKNYSLREKIIDEHLRRGWYSRRQIEDACNRELESHGEHPVTSRQTIINDFMVIERKYHTTIDTKQVGHTFFYRYLDRNFSIFKTQLTYEDYCHLKESLKLLKRFEGMPQFDWVDELGLRLDLGLRREKDQRTLVGFEDSCRNNCLAFFTVLFNAIADKITLSIDYQSFKRRESKLFVISPYFLKEYNHRWFLLGKSPGYERISIFAIDRIQNVYNAGVSYEDTDVDFDTYFENVIGVTMDDREPVQTVRLRISPQQIDYVETKPLHRSQYVMEKNEQGGIVELEVIPNYELEQTILALGEHCEVLSPPALRERIKARLQAAVKKYE